MGRANTPHALQTNNPVFTVLLSRTSSRQLRVTYSGHQPAESWSEFIEEKGCIHRRRFYDLRKVAAKRIHTGARTTTFQSRSYERERPLITGHSFLAGRWKGQKGNGGQANQARLRRKLISVPRRPRITLDERIYYRDLWNLSWDFFSERGGRGNTYPRRARPDRMRLGWESRTNLSPDGIPATRLSVIRVKEKGAILWLQLEGDSSLANRSRSNVGTKAKIEDQ